MSRKSSTSRDGSWKRVGRALTNFDEAVFMSEGELNARRLNAVGKDVASLREEVAQLRQDLQK